MDRNVATGADLSERVRGYLRGCVRIDTRALAAFRVLAGLLIVADLFLRARNFSFFYTEDGVVPQSLAMASTPDNAFSVYYLTTDPTLIAGLFVLQGLLAIQLIVGFKTRLATVLSFLLVVSLDHHNPLVLSYADVLFRLLLFWSIFLPLGERYSVDAVHAGRPPRRSISSVASALILGQVVYMYVVNGYHKSHDGLWTGGEATVLIMGLDNTTYLLGEFMRNFPTLLQYGGLMWYYLLVFGWLLIVLPGRPRALLVAMFMGGHASFIVTVRIGAFSYVALTGLLLFVPVVVWDDAAGLARRSVGSRIDAVRERLVGLAVRVPNPGLRSERQRWVREFLHDIALGVIVVSMVVVVAGSALQVGGVVDEDSGYDRQIENVAGSLAIAQPDWSVFAPTPRTADRYYVFAAETADGEHLDVYSDRKLSYERPYDELQKQFGTYRERFYMNSVRNGGFDNDIAPTLAEHTCRTWADERGVELERIDKYVITERVTAETTDTPEDRERSAALIYRHGCGDNDPREIQPPEL